MNQKINLIIFLVFFFGLFFTLGLPMLKNTKENISDSKITAHITKNNSNNTTTNTKTIDLSEDPMCFDEVLNEVKLECLTFAGCQHVCKTKGCLSYNLVYNGTDFNDRVCKCKCKI